MIRRVYIIPLYGTQDDAMLTAERARVGNISLPARQKLIISRSSDDGEMYLDVMTGVETFADLDVSANKKVAISTSTTQPIKVPTQSPLDNSTAAASTAYVDAAVTAGTGALNIEQVLINGSNAGDEGIENLGTITNTAGTTSTTMYNSYGYWAIDTRDTVGDDQYAQIEVYGSNSTPYIFNVVNDKGASSATDVWTGITQQANAIVIEKNPANAGQLFPGIVYSADYSANYTSRSLVDKAYVTSVIPTPAALTRVDDTNVTLTLGGTPSTALLQATSLTLGWSGQLSLARGGTNANLTASNGGIFYSTATAGAILAGTATAGQILRSGSSAAPSWSTATYPATTTANRVLYSTATNVIGDSANLTFDGTSLSIGGGAISGSGEKLRVEGNSNAILYSVFSNSTAGTASRTTMGLLTDGGLGLFLQNVSSSYTSSGMLQAGFAVVHTNAANGLNIGTITAKPLVIYTNNTDIGRFLSTGEFIIGATAVVSGEYVSIQKSQNASTTMRIKNATSGTAATSNFLLTNSDNLSLSMSANSAGFTTSGLNIASTAVILTNLTGGLNTGTTGAYQYSIWTNSVKAYQIAGTGVSTWYFSVEMPYVAKTANYTITTADYTIDCTSGTFTVTLPTAVGCTGRIYVIKNSGTLGGVITLDANGSQTIDGALTQTINYPDAITVQSNGANWIII